MTIASHSWIHLPPETWLDWLRFVNVLMGAYFIGMAVWIIRLYRDRKPVYHVRMVASGNIVLIAAIVYKELGLIGEPMTRVSWPTSIATCVALVPMIVGLHSLLRSINYSKDQS